MPSVKDSTSSAKVTRAAKKEKDPNAPKRPQSSYFLFAHDKRAEIKAKMPDAKVTEIAKELGKLWKDVSDAERKKYEEMALKEKEKYQRELNKYNKNSKWFDAKQIEPKMAAKLIAVHLW